MPANFALKSHEAPQSNTKSQAIYVIGTCFECYIGTSICAWTIYSRSIIRTMQIHDAELSSRRQDYDAKETV